MRNWHSVACRAMALCVLAGLATQGAVSGENLQSSKTLRSLEEASEALAKGKPKLARRKFEHLSSSSLQELEATDSLLRLLIQARGYLDEKPKTNPARILVCRIKSALNTRLQEEISTPKEEDLSDRKGYQPPRRIFDPQVWNPAPAWRVGAEGLLISKLVIDTDGCVASSEVVQGVHPDLDAPVQRTLLTWVYQPATLDGLPVTVYRNTVIDFTIPDE